MNNSELTEVKKAQRRLASIKRLHEGFMLPESEIASYLDSGMPYLELKKICLCGYITKKPVAEIIEMRKMYIWTRVLYLLGLSAEKLVVEEKLYKAERLERLYGFDKALVLHYMDLGFASHQIKRAYYISQHCDKPMLEILEMKTRLQKWPDIAESLGLSRDCCFGEKK